MRWRYAANNFLHVRLQEGVYADWEYDPSLLQPRRTPGGGGPTPLLWNWHEQIEPTGAYLYFWQANPNNGGRDVKRQSISFPQLEGAGHQQGAAIYLK